MVGGSVAPPRLDLANEDLVRSHVHAIWLAETGQDLRGVAHRRARRRRRQPAAWSCCPRSRERLADPAAAQRAADAGQAVLAGARRRPGDAAPWWRDELDRGRGQPARRSVRRRLRPLAGPVPARAARSSTPSRAPSVDTSRPAQGPRQRRPARPRRRASSSTCCSNEDSDDFQTDFYSYRYFASEGFLPGYSFPRLPLAAYIPGLAGRREGRLHPAAPVHRHRRVRPRRGDLPRGRPLPGRQRALPPAEPGQEGTVTATARRCRGCGYLHPEAVGIDVCENCGEPLRDTTRACCACTTVRTRRRDRISSDEEERRRAGFELQTSYRFGHHGGKPGRIDATVARRGRAGRSASPTATPRRSGSPTSAGAAGRTPTSHGYLIDVTTGRWLKENEREDQAAPEEDGLEAAGRRQAQAAGHPLRRGPPQHPGDPARRPRSSPETAVTAAIALERGIEAAFQLEDSELASETARPGRPGPGAVHRERRGRRRRAPPPGRRPRRAAARPPGRRWRSCTSTRTPAPTSAPTNPARPGTLRARPATTACSPTATSACTSMIDRHLVRDLMLRLAVARR